MESNIIQIIAEEVKKQITSLKKIARKSPTLGAKAPKGAVVLFDGKANPLIKGEVKGGLLWAGSETTGEYGDFHMHVEFRLPYKPSAPPSSQDRGNSGLYLQNRYEIQVLDGDKTEVFTFAYSPVGVKEFWSITRYSAITRNTIPGKNDLFNSYNTKPDAKGNITITFCADDPKDGTYWMPVNVGEPYYFIVRYYKADLNNLPPAHCD